jgi:hypothetical protein
MKRQGFLNFFRDFSCLSDRLYDILFIRWKFEFRVQYFTTVNKAIWSFFLFSPRAANYISCVQVTE